jgi:DNA invertase Pin-like site-specific DNA recombinase
MEATRRGDLIGYARVSTLEQNLQLQTDALEHAGCQRIFVEKASATRSDLPELARALDHLRAADTLVVWRLDRLGRSVKHLIEIVTGLGDRHIGFHSVRESIDTTTPGGRLVFHVFASLAEFERDLIRERTAAGLASARARGRHGGRPTVMTPERITAAKLMRDERDEDGNPVHRMEDIAATLGVSPASVYRALQRSSNENPAN